MASDSPPRRFKMQSELDDDEQALARRFGAAGRRFERAEYVRWRNRTLSSERDDLELRERLLREEADGLEQRAADAKAAGAEELTAEDWIERDSAKARGEQSAALPGTDRAAGFEADARELVHEANEIHAERQLDAPVESVHDHVQRIAGGTR